jgi:hypothetical protein
MKLITRKIMETDIITSNRFLFTFFMNEIKPTYPLIMHCLTGVYSPVNFLNYPLQTFIDN